MGRQRSRVAPNPIEARGKRTFERERASARRNFSSPFQTMVCATFQYTGALEGTVVGRPVVAALTELVWKHAARTAADLEALAKHAKRATVSVDDVLLSVRHNATLHRYMQAQIPEKVATKRKQV
uniref:Centromere protein S n=1 Tax=Ixodes ricinus TaxID=34613 RepID=A0A6B0UPM6_IXORI